MSRTLNVARMRKRVQAATPVEPVEDDLDEETHVVIRDLTGRVIRSFPRTTPAA